jgi:hypothetical protein
MSWPGKFPRSRRASENSGLPGTFAKFRLHSPAVTVIPWLRFLCCVLCVLCAIATRNSFDNKLDYDNHLNGRSKNLLKIVRVPTHESCPLFGLDPN